jgi:hypothetical protein
MSAAVVSAMVSVVVTGAAATGPVGAAEPVGDGPNRLSVEPASGPVGTRVTVAGEDCAVPGQDVGLVFAGGGGDVPEGGLGHPGGVIQPDAEDRFAVAFVIPAELGPFHGGEGGAVVPGRYWFQTLPPGCTGEFTVTASPAPPREQPTTTVTEPPSAPPATGAVAVRVQPRYTG